MTFTFITHGDFSRFLLHITTDSYSLLLLIGYSFNICSQLNIRYYKVYSSSTFDYLYWSTVLSANVNLRKLHFLDASRLGMPWWLTSCHVTNGNVSWCRFLKSNLKSCLKSTRQEYGYFNEGGSTVSKIYKWSAGVNVLSMLWPISNKRLLHSSLLRKLCATRLCTHSPVHCQSDEGRPRNKLPYTKQHNSVTLKVRKIWNFVRNLSRDVHWIFKIKTTLSFWCHVYREHHSVQYFIHYSSII